MEPTHIWGMTCLAEQIEDVFSRTKQVRPGLLDAVQSGGDFDVFGKILATSIWSYSTPMRRYEGTTLSIEVHSRLGSKVLPW